MLSPLLALLMVSCASVPKEGSPARVARIEMSYVEKLEHRVEELDALDRVRAGIGASLRREGLYSREGSLTLHVRIVSLRLRNAANSQLFGIMAGTDKLGVQVRAQRGEEIVESFDAGYSMAGGGSPRRMARLSTLVVKVTGEVAERMLDLDIRDPVPAATGGVDR